MTPYQNRNINNNTKFNSKTVVITSDSDEEEKAIKHEMMCIRAEFEEAEMRLRNLKRRLRRNYERLERIRIKRMVTQREREIRKELFQKWLPRLKYNQKRLIRMEQDVLNSISAPVQLEDGSTFEDEDGILRFTANEILESIRNNGNPPLNSNINNTKNV